MGIVLRFGHCNGTPSALLWHSINAPMALNGTLQQCLSDSLTEIQHTIGQVLENYEKLKRNRLKYMSKQNVINFLSYIVGE